MTGETRGRRRGPLLFVVVLVVVFAPPFVLTATRLWQPDSGRGAVLVSLTPLAIPLYVLLGLVALLGLVGPRRAARRVPTGVAVLVALAGLGVHLWWLSPAYVGSRPAAAPGAAPFGVLSLNLRKGEADPASIVAQATRQGVDVLVLVEITPRSLRALDAAGLGKRFPYRAGDAVPNVGGTMILSNAQVSDTVALDTLHGSWATTVALPQGATRVWAVHPRRPQEAGDGWHRDFDRLEGDLRTMPAPDVVAGDFNATADHADLRDLMAAGGLRDAAEMDNLGWKPTWPANGAFHGLPRFVQIDHVLVGSRLTALRTARIEVPDTDHTGVYARLAARAASSR